MDFLSNFIKRPMSLVLNNSAAQEETPTENTPSTCEEKSQEITQSAAEEKPHEKSLVESPPTLQEKPQEFTPSGQSAESLPNSISHTLAEGPHERATVNAEMHRVGPDKRPASSPAMLAGASIPDTNFTKHRIEELLLQFNDSLDQACLNDGTNVDEFLPIQLTPHAAKTPNTKFAATPKTPTKMPATELVVAESSLLETSPPNFDQFELDPLSVTGLLAETEPNSDLNEITNQFLEYTELAKTTLPELPVDLDVNFDGGLQPNKLSFEETFTPTLTANMNTSTADDNPKKSHIIFSPVVSDEETFSDCQSFTPKKQTKELSADADLKAEEPVEVHEIILGGISPEEFECEPMDVDISFSNDIPEVPEQQYYKPTVSSTREPVIHEYTLRGVTVSEFFDKYASPAKNIVQEEQYYEPAASSNQNDSKLVEATPEEVMKTSEKELELPQMQKEISFNGSIEQHSIDGAINTLPNVPADNTTVHVNVSPAVPMTDAAKVNENLTLNMTTSFGTNSTKGSAPASPTFPIKPSMDVTAFPRSPKKSVVKEPQFLEKSEYAEKMNSSAKQATESSTSAGAETKIRKSSSPVDNHNTSSEASASEKLNTTTVIESAITQANIKNAEELNSTRPIAEIKITPASPEQAESSETLPKTEELTAALVDTEDVEKRNSTIDADMLNVTTDLEPASNQTEIEMSNEEVLSAFSHKDIENADEKLPSPANSSTVILPEKTETRRTFVMTSPVKICDTTFDANSEEISKESTSECNNERAHLIESAEKEKRRTFTADSTNLINKTEPEEEKCLSAVDSANCKHAHEEKARRGTYNVHEANIADTPINEAATSEMQKQPEVLPKFDNSAELAVSKTTEEAKRRTFTMSSGIVAETEISKISEAIPGDSADTTDPAKEKRRTFVMNSGEMRKSSDAHLDNTTQADEEKQPNASNSKRLTRSEKLEIEKQELQRETERQEMLREIQNVNEETFEPMDVDADELATFNREDLKIEPQKPSYQAKSPPVPALQKQQLTGNDSAALPPLSPPLPAFQHRSADQFASEFASSNDAFKLPAPPMPGLPNFLAEEDVFKMPPPARSPPIPTMMKRRAIHGAADGFGGPTATELSAKEQKQNDLRNEKEDLSPLEACKPARESGLGRGAAPQEGVSDEEFGSGLIFNPADFDYLLSKGNDNVQIDRNSLLLKFDPLFGYAVPVKPTQKQLQQLGLGNGSSSLSSTLEEEERRRSPVETKPAERKPLLQKYKAPPSHKAKPEKNARMSADVITDLQLDNDCNKAFENSNSQADEKRNNYRMDELEKKIKNEVLKTEDIEKKLKESELREEALIKRITEKDKVISKMNGVIEAYEKTIAEMIAEKEQLVQKYETELMEVKADRDSNYRHLTSLEMTFSDLHVKYEKSKEMTLQLKANEESLLSERRQHLENMKLQEQRYDKMKNHAMQQLEIANKKLESQTKEHAIESTKLKALLKKEEISRASTNEQLQQKARENAELMKICDELINGQGS